MIEAERFFLDRKRSLENGPGVVEFVFRDEDVAEIVENGRQLDVNLFAAGIENVIVSGPGVVFASMMACRRDPGPASLVFTTVKT